MNKLKAEQLVYEAANKFGDRMRIPCEISVCIFNRQEAEEKRTELIRSLGAEYEPFQDTTMGETINGVYGAKIVIYPFNIFNKEELNHVLIHEMVHRVFRYENPEIDKKQIAGGYGKRMLTGFTLFDEFIAETVTFMITEESFYRNNCQQELIRTLWNALPGINPEMTPEAYYQREMYKAGIKVNVPELGYYIARLVADPVIISMIEQNPMLDRGFRYCSEEEADIIQDLAIYLGELFNNKVSVQEMLRDALIVTEEEMDTMGKMVLKLIRMR